MKKHLAAAVVLLLLALALAHFFRVTNTASSPPAPNTAPVAAQNANSLRPPPVASAPGAGNPPGTTAPSGRSAPSNLPAPDSPAALIPPEIVLQNVERMVRQYGQMFGGNPVGTNPEITSQLSGNNPKHINFLNPEAGLRINNESELVDAWGTPYFFHQISGTEMEIHSAGPDKIMWTRDDLVVK
jgi:hypothetical protein